ncbi:MAG TPA: T9SS type A sorting domain-containing protein [Bacteroidia bacterium]|nr:T9SS type A sorting domain-containing protein [Bacteroidia bacterium]
MKKFIACLAAILFVTQVQSQSWIELVGKPDANFYDIQKAFNAYFKDKDITVKGIGYKQYKRWEYIVEPRVYPSGDLSLMQQTTRNYETFLKTYRSENEGQKISSSSAQSATWMPVGPMGAPTGSSNGVGVGAGKDNGITFFPGNPSKLYICSANGGLWESTNGGASWSTNHDQLPIGACTDLLIDPNNTSIMYLATGGGDTQMGAYTDPSSGIYKTTNGGVTWSVTGLSYTSPQNRFIHKLAMDPGNSQVLFAATNVGLLRSTDAGATWSVSLSVPCWDVKFNPGNASIVYAAGNTSFYRSTNGGSSFSQVNAGIPTSGAYRMSLAVSPANPSMVYVLACKNSDYNFMGVYRSTDDGQSFTVASTSPNLLGNSCAGNSGGTGTGWWNTAIAASPSNSNEVSVGGVNVWRSTNGGVNWSVLGCWNSTGPSWLHADIHELEYDTTGTLYSSNDGGTYYFNGSNWVSLNAQRNTAEIYKLGLSALTQNIWITGHQDNGSNKKNGANYIHVAGGDGMDCFVDRTNDQILYSSAQNGSFRRSTNGGLSWVAVTSGLTGTADWVSPWKQDPLLPNTIYAGYSQLFKSTFQGNSWTQMGTTGGGGTVKEFAIAPSNNQVIYVLYQGSIRKTSDGGSTWSSANFSGGNPTFITIDPNDENSAWVTVSGYTAGNKVFQTTNGGASWTNISSNLPNIPANCSVYEPGSNDRIYIGMDIGVYYKDNSSPNWTLYNTGLPNVAVMDMEMTPAWPGQLFAATFGRGVYQADAVQSTAAPTPSFSYDGAYCVGVPKALTDNSSQTPNTWSWTITPSAGVNFNSNSVQNPTLTFNTPGIYTVSFVSGNGFGSGPVYTNTILVSNMPTLAITVSNSVTLCQGEELNINASGALSYTWSNGGGTNASVSYTPLVNWTYTVTGSNNGCLDKETVAVTVEACEGLKDLSAASNPYKLHPNPAHDKISITCSRNAEANLELYDDAGRLVKEQRASFKKESIEVQMSILTLPSGVYLLRIKESGGGEQLLRFVKD